MTALAAETFDTQASSHVEVTGRPDAAEQIYCVSDDGVGFDVSYADKLFGLLSLQYLALRRLCQCPQRRLRECSRHATDTAVFLVWCRAY
jgi:hypothetical protein